MSKESAGQEGGAGKSSVRSPLPSLFVFSHAAVFRTRFLPPGSAGTLRDYCCRVRVGRCLWSARGCDCYGLRAEMPARPVAKSWCADRRDSITRNILCRRTVTFWLEAVPVSM